MLSKTSPHSKVNDLFIEEHMPLIIKTISEITGKYVSLENDEEFSIGLLAFTEAVEKYDESKGKFHSFAKLVISSRIKNYLLKENKHSKNSSLEVLKEQGVDFKDDSHASNEDDKEELLQEIQEFKEELTYFNLTLEDLAETAPKHEDTRNNAISISKKVSVDTPLTTFIYTKKRLPIKQISLKYVVTEKILKRSKSFILSVVIIYFKNYRNLKLWIKQ